MLTTNVDRYRLARISSYALAGSGLLIAGPLVGLFDIAPMSNILAGWNPPFTFSIDFSLAVFVGLPSALAITVIARAASRTPTEIILGLFAFPCLLAGSWALYEHFFTHPGIYWGGLVTIAIGTLLAIGVLADGVAELAVHN